MAEIKYKQTSLRLTPGIFFAGAALEQEFEWKKTARLHLITEAAKTNFVISAQYQYQFRHYCPDECSSLETVDMAGLLAGIKTYKGRHFQYLKAGVLVGRTKKYNETEPSVYEQIPSISRWLIPFGEFGWGLYLFRE